MVTAALELQPEGAQASASPLATTSSIRSGLYDASCRVVALALLLLAVPVLVAAATAVVVTTRTSPLFAQVRVGQGGRLFTLWKLRTMEMEAESRLSVLLDLNDAEGLVFKIRHDPRVTAVGRWLRKFSIDELPQLWNVLRGDMSLVGPRPALPSEVARYDHRVAERLAVRPGLTGLWQVSGRSDLPWQRAVDLDLIYVRKQSILLDLRILLRTPIAVLSGRGAY